MLHGPAFRFDCTEQGVYAVVHASGELDIAAVPQLQAWVAGAARRTPRVVVDLRDVDFVDSFTLSALIALQAQAEAAPWSMHCVPGPGIQRLLDLAGARELVRWISPEQLAH